MRAALNANGAALAAPFHSIRTVPRNLLALIVFALVLPWILRAGALLIFAARLLLLLLAARAVALWLVWLIGIGHWEILLVAPRGKTT
jgi:hypothetical protein